MTAVTATVVEAKAIRVIVTAGRFRKVVVVHVVAVVATVVVVLVIEASVVVMILVLLLLLLFLYGTLFDVIGELCGGHSVWFFVVCLELGTTKLCLSKCCSGVDHWRWAGLITVPTSHWLTRPRGVARWIGRRGT